MPALLIFWGKAMKNISRAMSFFIVFLIYVFAAGVGVGIYLALPLSFWLKLLIADMGATVFVFIFSLIFKNASVYDPYWSVQPIVIVLAFALREEPLTAVHILPLTAVLIWGVRLTANWAYTFRGLGYEDWRYQMLKEKTGKFYPFVNFFGIHMVPTLVVYGCVLPVVFTFEENPAFNAGCAVFFALSILAVLLQGTADCEMHAFRKKGTGGFIRKGLWKYSRHPNYLGEIAMWWGVALAFVCLIPHRWYLIAGALANTLLFLFASIPLADKHQSRKRGFEAYKRNTRMLLPVYKKQK